MDECWVTSLGTMSAEELNRCIQRAHPGVWRCLSPLGRQLFYPRGITAQSAEAAGCPINATIGQLTDGAGSALPLKEISKYIHGIPDEEFFLYAPQGGRMDLRSAWRQRIQREGVKNCGLPMVTAGLTHALSLTADLFADPDTTVILPSPGWGNYQHIFGTRRGAKIQPWSVMVGSPEAKQFNINGLAEILENVSGKAILLLNFPSNPIGYSPTLKEAEDLVATIRAAPSPMVVVVDDAYHEMVWEENCEKHSLFVRLCELNPERHVVIKVCGATKELFFFGGRVGFFTSNVEGEAGAALEEKARAALRATVSAVSSPSQALVMAALRSPELEQQRAQIREQVRVRYAVLKSSLKEAGLLAWPFNSAFFALVHVEQDPMGVRRRLIDRGVGVVAFSQAQALRLSYSTLNTQDIPLLVSAIKKEIC